LCTPGCVYVIVPHLQVAVLKPHLAKKITWKAGTAALGSLVPAHVVVAAFAGVGSTANVQAVAHACQALKLASIPALAVDVDDPLFQSAVDSLLRDDDVAKAYSE
jgi:hypothetical protein